MPLSRVNPAHYSKQLETKVDRIRQQFSTYTSLPLTVYPSAPLHFRMRAEFKVWHQDNDSFYAMFLPEAPKSPVRIDSFPIGSTTINRLMPALLEIIKQQPILREKLFQCEFLTTQTEQAVVTLIYHKPLDDHWQAAARLVQERLNIHIIGRSRKQKCILGEDFVTETLQVDHKTYYFQQIESSFTQPNAGINEQMLSWARQQSQGIGGDLIELYCGNGNFTAVLAEQFDKVLATEISKTSVRSAKHNFALNTVDNVNVVRMSSEEFSQALLGTRSFRRLADIDLKDYRFSTVLVDPPRAGLDQTTLELVSHFDHIFYISCNPETLYRNLETLCGSHDITQFALFDQFPYTDHIECGVVLKRKIT